MDEFEQIYARFLDIADKKTSVNDDDIAAIVEDEIKTFQGKYKLVYIHAVCGTRILPSSRIEIVSDDGKEYHGCASGDGVIDATFKAINQALNSDFFLAKYELSAVSQGQNAIGSVIVQIEKDKFKVAGKGASTDIIEASAKAIIDGINKIEILRNKKYTSMNT